MLAALLWLVRGLPLGRGMEALQEWIAGLGIWGPVVLVLLYVLATVLFVPGTILSLAAGALFGLVVGTVTVSIGSTLGAAAAFLIARYAARERIAALAARHPNFGAVDRAIGEGGWRIVALLRLSPAIPFNLQNYLYGLTSIRFWPCLITSWLAMLPGTFLYIYLGHVTGAAVGAERTRTPAEWGLLAVGLLATVVVTVYITRLARRKLREQMRETEGSEKPAGEGGNGREPEASSRSPRGALLPAAAALLLLGAAAYVHFSAAAIERRVAEWLGPPRVEMREAYAENPSGPALDHAPFSALLERHVDAEGWVDYDGFQAEEAELDRYLAAVAAAPFEEMGRSEKLALLLNAYNAFTLKLILEHRPLESIREIPAAERWEAVRWNLGGRNWSLAEIEHEELRPKFVEPRIHFALVCGAAGCPPLRREAYVAVRLEQQLEEQAAAVHRNARWFQFDSRANVVRLTKLYDWYRGDFTQAAEGLLPFAARYAPQLREAMENGARPTITWLPHDWRLNSLANKPAPTPAPPP